MVAPVLKKDSTQRSIYLPKGKWYNMPLLAPELRINAGANGRTIVTEAKLGDMPIFVKAGTFLPLVLKNTYQTINDARTDTLTVHYFNDSEYSFGDLYDDDGHSTSSLEKRNYELIRFESYMQGERKYILVKTLVNGDYKGKPASRFIALTIHGAEEYVAVLVNKKLFPLEKNADGSVTLTFTYTGEPVLLLLR